MWREIKEGTKVLSILCKRRVKTEIKSIIVIENAGRLTVMCKCMYLRACMCVCVYVGDGTYWVNYPRPRDQGAAR